MKIHINVAGHTHLLFAGKEYYAEGGWEDFKGSFLSAEEAMRAFDKMLKDDIETAGETFFSYCPWAHVVNPAGVIVWSFSWRYNREAGGWKTGREETNLYG